MTVVTTPRATNIVFPVLRLSSELVAALVFPPPVFLLRRFLLILLLVNCLFLWMRKWTWKWSRCGRLGRSAKLDVRGDGSEERTGTTSAGRISATAHCTVTSTSSSSTTTAFSLVDQGKGEIVGDVGVFT